MKIRQYSSISSIIQLLHSVQIVQTRLPKEGVKQKVYAYKYVKQNEKNRR